MIRKNIFLDFDGTIVDIESRHYTAYKKSLESIRGGVPIGRNEYWRMKRRDSRWREILSISGDEELEKEFLNKFIEIIESAAMLKLDTTFDGVLEFLKELKKSNNIYLVSLRRNHDNLIYQLEHLGLDNIFHKVFSGHSDTKKGTLTKKSDVLRKLNLKDADIIIGDTEADICAAKQLGVGSIAITSGIRDKEYLSNYSPDFIFPKLVDINRRLL